MSVSLRGNLQDFGIADVFQLIGQQRKTGVLEFAGHGEQIQFLFDRGAIVSAAPVGLWSHAALGEMLLRCGLLTRDRVEALRAECEASAQTLPGVAIARGWLEASELRQIEDLLTRETIFSVLRWQFGSFDFTAQEVEHDREFDSLLGAEQVLMDGLRMVDEWHSFAELVPSEDLVFQRVLSFEEFRERASGESARYLAASERVFSLIDGRLAVRRIIDLSLLGTFDAVRALANLHRARAIEPVDPARLPRPEGEAKSTARAPRLTRVAATIVPFALLAAVVAAAYWKPAPAAQPGFAIERPALLEAARRNLEMRRVRHAVDTHWFETGRWPAKLDELGRDALASASGRAYYFANRDDGFWLLAPEP